MAAPRRSLLLATLLLLLLAVPTASAFWTTSATVPASFRPNRTVTFSYAASSSNQLELGIAWTVQLLTCKDTNADGVCTSGTDANYHDFGTRSLNANAGASGSVSWSVNLADPLGAYTYNFNPACAASPCAAATHQPAPEDTKRGLFQLAYTNTWTRTLTVPALAVIGSSSTVTYRLASTSPDDADITGNAELMTLPNASTERTEGTRPISILATSQQTLSWNVTFNPSGRQQERVVDSTTSAQAFANASVLDAQLNVTQPGGTIPSGGVASLYITLSGRGSSPDPMPLSAPVRVILRNGSFTLQNTTLSMDANGTAYLGFVGAQDLANVSWTANATLTWNGFPFAPTANGTIHYAPGTLALDAAASASLDAIRHDVADLGFHGVQLNEVGTHNLLLEAGRIAVYAALAAGLVLLLVIVSFRV